MKTIRKMMINAFEKYARQSGWTDSKKNSCNLSQFGYKSARQWAREIVSCYDYDSNGFVKVLKSYNGSLDDKITQKTCDDCAEEEMSCY